MRPIDADALKENIFSYANEPVKLNDRRWNTRCIAIIADMNGIVDNMPTIGGWTSIKDGLPSEHDSLFANNPHLSKHMWAKESDDVIVYVVFPDGTGRATEGRLRDGKWNTKISQVLEPVITHWMPFPESPET